MAKFNLTGKVTISVYTCVEADTLEEAIKIAEGRDEIKASHWGADYEKNEAWLSDEYDGEVFDIEQE